MLRDVQGATLRHALFEGCRHDPDSPVDVVVDVVSSGERGRRGRFVAIAAVGRRRDGKTAAAASDSQRTWTIRYVSPQGDTLS